MEPLRINGTFSWKRHHKTYKIFIVWKVQTTCAPLPSKKYVGIVAWARDVYGAALDGGVNAARPPYSNNFRPAAYLDVNISNANRREELELEDSENGNDMESRIHDEGDLKPGWLDQSRDHSQK